MTRPVRVLQINDKLSMDGVHPSSCTLLFGNWIPGFDPRRFRFSVCTLRDPDPAGGYLEQLGIRVHRLGHGKLSPRNIAGIGRLIRSEGADIVHLHGYASANFGRIAARRAGVVNIVHEHAILRVLPHQYLADRALRGLTDAAVAVSHGVKRFMVRGRSIPPERIRVIGNCVDLRKFRPLPKPEVARRRAELGLGDGARAVGVITRLRREKGNEYLIRAMPGLLAEFPETVLLVAGGGPLRPALERLARELGVAEFVRFLGHVGDPAALLACSDVVVIPSLTEGFPLALIEAMAVGRPIVATAVGGMTEIGVDGKTVVFVPPRDPAAIAAAVGAVFASPGLAGSLADRAFAARDRFGIEHNVSRLSDLYAELCPWYRPG